MKFTSILGLVAAGTLLATTTGHAADQPGGPVRSEQPGIADEPVKGAEAEAKPESAETLTGDWGGLRTRLAGQGIQLGATYMGETLANVGGGVRDGAIYEGRLAVALDLDFDRLLGWGGATGHAEFYQIHGRGLGQNAVRSLMSPSNIEAERANRLWTLWLQQTLWQDKVSLRVGQQAADEEFWVSSAAGNLINGTFGAPALISTDLASNSAAENGNGGDSVNVPIYPLAAPGLRLRLAPTKRISWQSAVFSGDAAGGGSNNDPQQRSPHSTAFSTGHGALVLSELAYAAGGEGTDSLPGTYKIGGWYHSGRFNDMRIDTTGGALAASGGAARQDRGNYGFYAVADQMLWRKAGTSDQGLGAFLRAFDAPQQDRNQIDWYVDGGLGYKGPFGGRDDDVVTLGVAYAHIGRGARGFDNDQRSLAGLGAYPIRTGEAVVELSYLAELTEWWTLQPDVQYIFSPGGNIPNPMAGKANPDGITPSFTLKDTAVLGVRSTIKF